jgi:hypothetical protein
MTSEGGEVLSIFRVGKGEYTEAVNQFVGLLLAAQNKIRAGKPRTSS